MSSYPMEDRAEIAPVRFLRSLAARLRRLKLLSRLAWLKSGLLWRTFFLLAFLVSASMGSWFASYRLVEREPRANQIAAQVVSVVTITRAALMHAAAESRRELLFDLASNEGIRIYPLEGTDVVERPSDRLLMPLIEKNVKEHLGNDTQFASVVNDTPGFWVSFKIDDDEYWLMLERERIERTSGIQWAGWATATLLLSLLGAIFISRLINQPLARLTAAASSIAKGRQPDPLPEMGPTEMREANRSFNQMVTDLHRVESDRAVILAGISHDLRTPISRMTLELEMARLPEEAKQGMAADLAQMDAIISQFLDYAKPVENLTLSRLDVSNALREVADAAARLPDVSLRLKADPGIEVAGHPIELKRVFNNLIENARRYGKSPASYKAEIEIRCVREGDQAVIDFLDGGPGIPQAEMERVLRPFTRINSARSQANGAGLGLAIVDRVVKRHHGTIKMSNRPQGGLSIRILLPLAK